MGTLLLLLFVVIDDIEATSFLGRPLRAKDLPFSDTTKLEAAYEEARTRALAAPDSVELAVWHGRRAAYLGRYRDAVTIFTEALERHPQSPELYRHRGHRYITLREIDKAIGDLSRAAELCAELPDRIEPDGAPNAFKIPLSTRTFNIDYHLGLAYFLDGQYERACDVYERCLVVSRRNNDLLTATAQWLTATYRRLGRHEDARKLLSTIDESMRILENDGYHELLLLAKGTRTVGELLAPEGKNALMSATVGFGVGQLYQAQGELDQARKIYEQILETPYWSAFGYIAAERELARMRDK